MSDDAPRPLLLHSLAEFRELIFACLEPVRPRRVVEIGGEGGTLTQALAGWAAEHDCELLCVEPIPSPPLLELAGAGKLTLIRGKTPGALEALEPCDVYVVDGDHNHWVVSNELEGILAKHDEAPLVVLHDVAWPCARRDTYYAPADVPGAARQPYTYQGALVPGDPGVAPAGFSGAGQFAYALREGGPRNGVLTAVEDVMAAHAGLELLRIPAIFGVGVLFPSGAPWADAVRAAVGPFHEHPLLERLEANRLALYVEVLRLYKELELERARMSAVAGGLGDEVGALRAELAELRLAAAGGPR